MSESYTSMMDQKIGNSSSSRTIKPDETPFSKLNIPIRNICQGIKAFFLGNGLGKVQKNILSKQLTAHGGLPVDNIDNASHLIVSKSVKPVRILNYIGHDIPVDVMVVKSDWLSACFLSGKRCKESDFLVSTELSGLTHGVDPISKYHEQSSDLQPVETIDRLTCEQTICPKQTPSKKLKRQRSNSYSDSDNEPSYHPEQKRSLNMAVKYESESTSTSDPTSIKVNSWTCSKPSTSKPQNYNDDITSKLEILAKSYSTTQDKWRAFGYKKAINVISKHPKRLSSKEEIQALPHVGSRLADKIWEIVETGHLRRLDHMDPNIKTLNLFADLWGAGPKTAETWVAMGCKTLQDLKDRDLLNFQQKIGIRHYDEFLERMSREEVQMIEEQVRHFALQCRPGLQIVTCGSYRRGRETCGDIDILISHPDGLSHIGLLPILIQKLKEEGLITDDLITVRNDNQTKYMGVFKLQGEEKKHRRIDIIVAPHDEFPCALVHFTGSGHLNRSMRHLAATKDMSLSEHSLRSGVVRKDKEKLTEGVFLKVKCEKDIFDYLGLDYLEPHQRDW